MTQATPTVIISWVILGNVYPVYQDHKGPESLLGYVALYHLREHICLL